MILFLQALSAGICGLTLIDTVEFTFTILQDLDKKNLKLKLKALTET